MAYDSLNSCRLPKEPPSPAFAGWPFGFFRVGLEGRAALADSVSVVLSALADQTNCTHKARVSTAIQSVRHAFWRVATTDSADWFTLFRAFGYPSTETCRTFIRCLGKARRSLRLCDNDGYRQALEVLTTWEGPTALATFQSGADPREGVPLAYILWADGTPYLAIGASDTELPAFSKELGLAEGGRVYGALGAWRVADAAIARSAIERRLARFASDNGHYDVPLALARSEIEKALPGMPA